VERRVLALSRSVHSREEHTQAFRHFAAQQGGSFGVHWVRVAKGNCTDFVILFISIGQLLHTPKL
jgi:hypothetical protein